MSRRLRRVVLATVVVGSVAVLATVVVLLGSPGPSSPCTLPPPASLSKDSTLLLVPCGADVTVHPHSFVSYTMVRLSDQMIVEGQFRVSGSANGSLGAYLLNSSEISGLLANPAPQQLPTEYFWSSGPGPVCNVSVSIPGSPGQYYVVVVNVGSIALSLEWPHGFVLYYGPD